MPCRFLRERNERAPDKIRTILALDIATNKAYDRRAQERYLLFDRERIHNGKHTKWARSSNDNLVMIEA